MSQWATDRIPAPEMIPVSDVVRIVEMLLGLSRNSCIARVVVSRSGTRGYEA
jgi:hypothetical protein